MAISDTSTPPHSPVVDFSDTRIGFAHKNNRELRHSAWLFRFINQPWLVKIGGAIGLWLNNTGINIFNPVIKATIFKQFCGGTSLRECGDVVRHLKENNTLAILDYGAEGKTRDEEFDQTMEENIKAITFASSHPVPLRISTKITALCSFALLEKIQTKELLNAEEELAYSKAKERVDRICHTAHTHDVTIFMDAEETWIQDTIDDMVKQMMEKYNRDKVIIYHTYQLYRHDKLKSLLADHQEAKEKKYFLGAKLVRGAYMEKERKRAKEMNYPSPIQITKENTDRDYNEAVNYCVEHYTEIGSCNASHNMQSNMLQVNLMSARNLPKDHPHLSFSQLYGMSDNITFNLASAGYNVAKYLPYGPVREVVPYLIRRARENTAVTGEMSRELALIVRELKRREMK